MRSLFEWTRPARSRERPAERELLLHEPTRRFCARPASSALDATGDSDATPFATRRAGAIRYVVASACVTASARLCDRSTLCASCPGCRYARRCRPSAPGSPSAAYLVELRLRLGLHLRLVGVEVDAVERDLARRGQPFCSAPASTTFTCPSASASPRRPPHRRACACSTPNRPSRARTRMHRPTRAAASRESSGACRRSSRHRNRPCARPELITRLWKSLPPLLPHCSAVQRNRIWKPPFCSASR